MSAISTAYKKDGLIAFPVLLTHIRFSNGVIDMRISCFLQLMTRCLPLSCSLVLLSGLAGPPASAQDNSPQTGVMSSASSNENIRVHGMTPMQLRGEVDKLTSAPWNSQLARWDDNFCLLMTGITDPYRDIVYNRIMQTVRSVLPQTHDDCSHPTAFVVFTGDGSATFEEILAKAPMLGNTAPPVAISTDDFVPPTKAEIDDLRRSRPVRWYRSRVTVPAPGVYAVYSRRFGRFVLANNIKISNFEKDTQSKTSSVMVIVDGSLATGERLYQLADYLAFVLLAGPKLDENFSDISIMSLFNNRRFNPAAPSGLTQFDNTMLQALYHGNPAREAHDEQAEIASQVRSLARAQIGGSTSN